MLNESSRKTGVPSGQEKDRSEQTICGSDMANLDGSGGMTAWPGLSPGGVVACHVRISLPLRVAAQSSRCPADDCTNIGGLVDGLQLLVRVAEGSRDMVE